MALDKSIHHGKEHRKQYRKSAAFDTSCRPHGGCPWCERNRKFNDMKKRTAADEQVRDYRGDMEER